MNILILTYQGGIAGSTFSISYLAKGLAEKGHSVYVGCRKNVLLYDLLDKSTVTVIPMEFNSKLDLSTIKKVKQAVRKYNIDIINAQSSIDRYICIFAKLFYGLNVKIVHTRRQTPRSSGGFIHGFFYTYFTDRIVAVSNGVKRGLMDMGIPENHITVIYNGTPNEKYDHLSQNKIKKIKKSYNITPKKFIIGCISRRKKQEQLLKALARLDFPSEVILVGAGKREIDEPIIQQNNLSDRIHYVGRVSPKQALHYYKVLDVFILPSVTEGLSQSILEAMALEIPVIATAAAGNLDLIDDEINGFLFEDDNIDELVQKILIIKSNPEKVSDIISNAKKTALVDFSVENTVKRYETFFRNLIESNLK